MLASAPRAEQPREVLRLRRELNNWRSFIRRGGLTGWVKDRNCSLQYEHALRAMFAVEELLGVEHPTTVKLDDRLRRLYYESRDAGLLSPSEIFDAERRALGEGKTP